MGRIVDEIISGAFGVDVSEKKSQSDVAKKFLSGITDIARDRIQAELTGRAVGSANNTFVKREVIASEEVAKKKADVKSEMEKGKVGTEDEKNDVVDSDAKELVNLTSSTPDLFADLMQNRDRIYDRKPLLKSERDKTFDLLVEVKAPVYYKDSYNRIKTDKDGNKLIKGYYLCAQHDQSSMDMNNIMTGREKGYSNPYLYYNPKAKPEFCHDRFYMKRECDALFKAANDITRTVDGRSVIGVRSYLKTEPCEGSIHNIVIDTNRPICSNNTAIMDPYVLKRADAIANAAYNYKNSVESEPIVVGAGVDPDYDAYFSDESDYDFLLGE